MDEYSSIFHHLGQNKIFWWIESEVCALAYNRFVKPCIMKHVHELKTNLLINLNIWWIFSVCLLKIYFIATGLHFSNSLHCLVQHFKTDSLVNVNKEQSRQLPIQLQFNLYLKNHFPWKYRTVSFSFCKLDFWFLDNPCWILNTYYHIMFGIWLLKLGWSLNILFRVWCIYV